MFSIWVWSVKRDYFYSSLCWGNQFKIFNLGWEIEVSCLYDNTYRFRIFMLCLGIFGAHIYSYVFILRAHQSSKLWVFLFRYQCQERWISAAPNFITGLGFLDHFEEISFNDIPADFYKIDIVTIRPRRSVLLHAVNNLSYFLHRDWLLQRTIVFVINSLGN